MYRREFDDDWTTLPREDAVSRAYALGVAAVCGDPDPEEFQRLLDDSDAAYDRSMIELAYREGKADAEGHGDDGEAVWNELVADDEGTALRGSRPASAAPEDGSPDGADDGRGRSVPAPGGEAPPTSAGPSDLLERRCPDRRPQDLPAFLTGRGESDDGD